MYESQLQACEGRSMSPATFCKCGAGVCGHRCCKTEQDPKKCDGIWYGSRRRI